MNRIALAISALAATLVCALLGLCVRRVGSLMDRELDRAGPVTLLAPSEEPVLLEADLLEGDYLTFELCSSDAMAPERWSGAVTLSLEAGARAPREPVLEETLDDAMLGGARRSAAGACLDFARAGPLQRGGHYVVSAGQVGEGLRGVDVRARVLAERPLVAGDRNFVLGILLGALAIVIGLALRQPARPTPDAAVPWSAAGAFGLSALIGAVGVAETFMDPRLSTTARGVIAALVVVASLGGAIGLRRAWSGAGAILGVLGVIELSLGLSVVTPPGPAFGLLAGLGLAGCEIAIAATLAHTFAPGTGTASSLGLERPPTPLRAWAGFAAAPFAGLALRMAAMRVLSLVPSTGEAPIEAYVSWPSGLLSFAALSTIAPIGEEIFFRGLVYGALRGKGGPARSTLAFAGAWGLFVVAHLPQTWGSWGGLAAVAVAGLGFTALRALTGSVLVSALAHLVYNGLLAVAALATA